MGVGMEFDENRIPSSTLQELRGILMSSLSRENLGQPDTPPEPRRRKVRFEDNAGAAPVETSQRQSRPSSINKGRARPKSLGHTLHWFACVGQEPEFEPDCYDYDDAAGAVLSTLEEPPLDPNNSGDAGSRDGGAASQDREERARQTRERQNSERARKLEELRAQALSAQRFREQKEEERRRRIDEMRSRDNDRRHQVEERKRAIWEAERERREAIVRRNEEREARLEGKRRGGGANAVGVFAFGSSTPRMLEPADTGGTFWGHRRATSTSNVMFAALPLSRRSSERELDPNKKRATSASGLDRQAGDDYRVSATTMYDVFHWDAFGAGPSEAANSNQREIFPVQFSGYKEESGGDGAPWSRVARRRTDLVPTLTSAPRSEHRTPRSPGRAYSMTRLDQLSQPRKQSVLVAVDITSSGGGGAGPVRPPRHRSSGQLSRAAGHRSVGNLLAAVGPAPPPRRHALRTSPTSPGQTASGLRSGEVTPGSPSRPGSSLSSASTLAGAAMTSSVMGTLVNRRPRAAPRRPRPASIAGTGVTTPPHVKTSTVGADGKLIGLRAEKPPLPRVHAAPPAHKKHTAAGAPTAAAPTASQDKPEVPKRAHKGGSVKASPRITPRTTPLQSPASDLPPSVLQDVQEATATEHEEASEVSLVSSDSQLTSASLTDSTSTITETVKQVTKEVIVQPGGEETTKLTTVTTVNNNGDIAQSVKTEALVSTVVTEDKPETMTVAVAAPKAVVEVIKKVKEETVEVAEKKETLVPDALEVADMTASMSLRSRGAITTEEEAKAALAERRRLAREEAERAAERERLRLEKEEQEEEERQRQEEERQRRLEEETIRLSELQRQSEEERLQQAILEAERFKEEEIQRKESELRARAEREVAEVKAREEAERARQETAERLRKEDEEREARRRRVEAIMLRTRQAKQKKDGDKSPTEENKSLEDTDQKFIENKMAPELSQQQAVGSVGQLDQESAYELSVRQREEALFSHTAPLNTAAVNSFQNGAPPTNGTAPPSNGDSAKERELAPANSHYPVQNGHTKSQMNELNNFINTNSENQYNNVALDNAVIQNNVSNNLLDISEVDLLNTNKNNPFLLDINTNSTATSNSNSNGGLLQQTEGQMLDLSTDSISKNFVNEDSMNSNQTSNSPFITSFQDNQENRDVSLL